MTAELTEDHDAISPSTGGAAVGGAGASAGDGSPSAVAAALSDPEVTDKLWAQLLSFHGAGFLMGASCNARDGVAVDFDTVGLMPNHAYSVLEVTQVDHHRLVRLHNPWGRCVHRNGSALLWAC